MMPEDELPLGPEAVALLPMAARVLLDGAVADLEFDYAIPPALDGVGPGSRVSVPLRNRTMTGTVLIVYPAAEAEVTKREAAFTLGRSIAGKFYRGATALNAQRHGVA